MEVSWVSESRAWVRCWFGAAWSPCPLADGCAPVVCVGWLVGGCDGCVVGGCVGCCRCVWGGGCRGGVAVGRAAAGTGSAINAAAATAVVHRVVERCMCGVLLLCLLICYG